METEFARSNTMTYDCFTIIKNWTDECQFFMFGLSAFHFVCIKLS